jgi:regulator of RNase E activity RraA
MTTMTPMTTLSPADLAALCALDTPTVCNALERLDPATQARGYTTQSFICGFPQAKPIVGFARTAAIRAASRSDLSLTEQRALRAAYYRHVDAGPRPSIVVIEDEDGAAAACGAFWGEVQSAIHVGLGAVGLVTNGAVRDLDQWAPGFQFLAGRVAASHAFARPVRIGGEVTVLGMTVRDGDLIHADRHGAVVVPPALVSALPQAAADVAAREARILAVARAPGCTAERLIDTLAQLDAFH